MKRRERDPNFPPAYCIGMPQDGSREIYAVIHREPNGDMSIISHCTHDEAVTMVTALNARFYPQGGDRDGRTVVEKLLVDELVAARATIAELMQRLLMAHSALHVEQAAHDTTKARFERFKREHAKSSGVEP